MRLVSEEEWQALQRRLDEVEKRLKGLTGSDSEWMAEAEVSRYLRRSKQWLWRQRIEGVLAYAKVGRAVYYRRADVTRLLEQGSVKRLDE